MSKQKIVHEGYVKTKDCEIVMWTRVGWEGVLLGWSDTLSLTVKVGTISVIWGDHFLWWGWRVPLLMS